MIERRFDVSDQRSAFSWDGEVKMIRERELALPRRGGASPAESPTLASNGEHLKPGEL